MLSGPLHAPTTVGAWVCSWLKEPQIYNRHSRWDSWALGPPQESVEASAFCKAKQVPPGRMWLPQLQGPVAGRKQICSSQRSIRQENLTNEGRLKESWLVAGVGER